MKKYILVLMAFGLFPFLPHAALTGEEIVIESRLFKGIRQERMAQEEIVISSLTEPFIVPVRPSDIEDEKWTVVSLQRELCNLYQFRQVDHLVSTNMIWDGKKRDLSKTILLDGSLLPISFSPEIVSEQSANLRIRVTQLTGMEMRVSFENMIPGEERRGWFVSGPMEIYASEMSMRELLDTEITLNFNQPVVLGFSVKGTSYFLEVLLNNKKETRNFQGIDNKSRKYAEIPDTDTDFFRPPNPVREVRPVYPEKCKEKRIEGAVILQVGIDAEGNVIETELLKSAHKYLDKAAMEAIRQWKYRPVKKDGKPVPVTFTVTVDFKLRAREPDEDNRAFFPGNRSAETAELDEILAGCAEYCERLAGAALHFVCEERISEEISLGYFERTRYMTNSGGIIMASGGGRNLERNEYVYDYQLIKKEDKIEETRILLKENGKKKHEKNAPLKTKRFYSKRPVYGPIGLLSKGQQDYYTYRILKEQTIKKRKSYVIEVTPKAQIEENPNHGKVWVDKEDFSILKIEIVQESLAGFEKVEQESKKQRINPFITTTHDYFIEKNGIRFPSGTICEEIYRGRPRIAMRMSETIIAYDNYKFFTVETKVKY